MANKRQRTHTKLQLIFQGTTGTTGTRDTKINDWQHKYKLSQSVCVLWANHFAKSDVLAS